MEAGALAVLGAGRMADKGGIVSVWRVVSPPGYGSLGDVVSLGLDPPTAPVTVSPTLRALPASALRGTAQPTGSDGLMRLIASLRPQPGRISAGL